MTRDEMHSELKFLLDKVDSSAAPLFLSEEMDKLLNIAQDKFIAKRAFGNNPRRTSFEEDQKRRDDLRTLIVQKDLDQISSSDINKPNAFLVAVPEGYRHAINEEALINTVGVQNSERRVSVKPITHDRYNKIADDPFNKPDKNTVYRLDYGGDAANDTPSFELICGEGQAISVYYLRMLRNPEQISSNTNCSLAVHTHREVVRMAVVEALEGIESPRYQTSKIELNEIE